MKPTSVTAQVALAIAMTGLQGCAYKIPIKDNEPTATIRFVDPRNAAAGRSLVQTPTKITLLDESGCNELGHVAGIGSFNDYKMDLTVPANKKLVFQWFSTAPGVGGMWHCKLVRGFAPEANQLYEARFDMDIEGRACSVDLVKLSRRPDGTSAAARLPMSSSSPDACKTASR